MNNNILTCEALQRTMQKSGMKGKSIVLIAASSSFRRFNHCRRAHVFCCNYLVSQCGAIPVYQHTKLLMTNASFLRKNHDLSSLDIS